jgi:hypothetical protein
VDRWKPPHQSPVALPTHVEGGNEDNSGQNKKDENRLTAHVADRMGARLNGS